MVFQPHIIIAVLTFLSGLVNIISALTTFSLQRFIFLKSFLPLEILHTSRTLSLAAGFYLIYLSKGLWQKKHRAWLLTLITISISLILHLLKGLDFEEDCFLIIPLILLITNRQIFTVQSGPLTTTAKLKNALIILLILLIYYSLGSILLPLFPHLFLSRWFIQSLYLLAWIAAITAIDPIFAPLLTAAQTTETTLKKARNLVIKYGQSPSSYLTLMPDKQYFFSASNQAFIAYTVKNNTAVILGDPIGLSTEIPPCLSQFLIYLHQKGLQVTFHDVTKINYQLYRNFHFKLLKFGDEALINPVNFSLDRPELKTVRNSVNKINREGITFRWYDLKNTPWHIINDVARLHSQWLSSKPGPSLTFSVDFFPFPPESQAHLLITANPQEKILAAFSFYPYFQNHAAGLELMLRDPNGPNGLAESMIIEAINHFHHLGFQKLSLGVAPLSHTHNKFLNTIFNRFNQFYGYKSLYAFKNKFNPAWKPHYIVYKNLAQLPKSLLAILQVHTAKIQN